MTKEQLAKLEEKRIPADVLERMKTLNNKEKMYFSMMYPKSGVLYITDRPGSAKSAIAREIARKMGYYYLDLRLTLLDETDLGLYPSVKTDEEKIEYLVHIISEWALIANKQKTIICFDELNRASKALRNAALQILLERGIGFHFKFNDGVLMMATGNLGDEDKCEVELFDDALNGRLIHVRHSLSTKEWLDNYANMNVHKIINDYIELHPEYMYTNPTEQIVAYASPRTWTFLSDYIICMHGYNSTVSDFLEDIQDKAHCYIGAAAVDFINYCHDMTRINIQNILNDYDNFKNELAKCRRDKIAELMTALQHETLRLDYLNDKQMGNLYKFFESDFLSDDERTAHIIFLADQDELGEVVNGKKKMHVNKKNFLNRFNTFSSDLLIRSEKNKQAHNVQIVDVTKNTAKISWTNGNNTGRVVFIKEGDSGNALPEDKTSYNGNSIYGTGDALKEWFCVCNNTNEKLNKPTLEITNLKSNTEYRIMICEYNITELNGIRYIYQCVSGNPLNFNTI